MGHIIADNEAIQKDGGFSTMKGYYVGNGYMGYVDGMYMLFSDEADYEEYICD